MFFMASGEHRASLKTVRNDKVDGEFYLYPNSSFIRSECFFKCREKKIVSWNGSVRKSEVGLIISNGNFFHASWNVCVIIQ